VRVFIAGASGAIGRPLVRQLVEAGHDVTGMTRSNAERIRELGATPRDLRWQPRWASWRDGFRAELG